MIHFFAAVVASLALLGASAVQSATAAGHSVVAFDSDNGHGNNGNGNDGNGNGNGENGNDNGGNGNSGAAPGHNKNKDSDEDESSFRGRHASITGCVASFDRSRVFTLQTNSGLITVEPTGNAVNEINLNDLRVGRIITAQGHFAGNGVYLAQQLTVGGTSSAGTCGYAGQPFPTPGNFGVGDVSLNGTIQSMSGNTLRLSTSYGGQTVVYDANTLVDYGNSPVGSNTLRVGENVTVVGLRQTNGASIYARSIQIQSGVGIGQSAVVAGVVVNTNLNTRQFTVFSGMQTVTVDLTPQTVVQRNGARVDPNSIRAFMLVTVYGNRSGNVVTASSVQL